MSPLPTPKRPAVVLAALLAGAAVLVPALPAGAASTSDLATPAKKEIAMELVSSAENSTLDWKGQYGYIEDIGDGRGYTGGIIGFTSGTDDMLEVVELYTKHRPGNPLAKFLPALRKVNGSDSHRGLGAAFVRAWRAEGKVPAFQRTQDHERDRYYFDPAVRTGKRDGLGALGQFIYYDAYVTHGPGDDWESFGGIRKVAMQHAATPAQGGNETTYLNAFLDARVIVMKSEEAHEDVTRIEHAQRKFLREGNVDLHTPLVWSVYDDHWRIP